MSRYGSMKTSTAHEIPLAFQKVKNNGILVNNDVLKILRTS